MPTKITTLLFIFISFAVDAQLKLTNLNQMAMKGELSTSSVECIYKDSYGFVWVGTQNGLNLFDGNSITQFYYTDGDSGSKIYPDITAITEDKFGTIWIGTNGGGIYRFDRKNGHFTNIHLKDIQANDLSTLYCDSEGTVWIGTGYNGLWYLKQNSTIPVKYDSLNFNVNGIIELHDKSLLVATNVGLFSVKNSSLTKINDFQINIITLVLCHDILVLGTDNGLLLANEKSLEPIQNPTIEKFRHNTILSLETDSLKQIWIGTRESGLWSLKFRDGLSAEPVHYMNTFRYQITTLYMDQKSTLWIGTLGKGAFKTVTKKPIFTTYETELDQENLNKVLWAISEDENGEILIGTESQGIFNWQTEHRKWITLPEFDFLRNQSIRSLFKDSKKRLWVGTDGTGVFIFENHKLVKKITAEIKNPNGLKSNKIRNINEDKSGRFWICTREGGVSIVSSDLKKINTIVNSSNSNPVWLGHNNTWKTLPDSNGITWIATSAGLTKYNEKTNTSTTFAYADDRKQNGIPITVMSMIDDGNGFLWLATRYDGLIKFEKSSGKMRTFDQANGFSGNGMLSLLLTKNNILWLSSDHGLSSFNLTNYSVKNWNEQSGLPGNEFNAGAGFSSPSGIFYFGGTNGLVSINPEITALPAPEENIFIRKITMVDNKSQNKTIHNWEKNPEKLEIEPNIILLEFEYAILDYENQHLYNIEYQLDGYSPAWVKISGKNIQFSRLDPGNYNLKIRNQTDSESRLSVLATIPFYVAPEFWQTYTFKGVVVGVILSFAYLIFLLELRRRSQINKLRLQIASDLHDDVGIILTKIALKTELILSEISDFDLKPKLEVINKLSRDVIMTMSDAIWSIDTRNKTLSSLLDRMKGYTQYLFENEKVRYEFIINGINPDLVLSPDIKQNILLVFKECLNNIMKHSDSDFVRISVLQTRSKFEMTVFSNGEPKKKGFAGTGSGINNMKLRAERMNGILSVLQENGFTVTLTRRPLGK